ncbi:MAG TPA: PIN domain-containing protein [Solirubrobacteraceae bacterium]
MGLILLDSNVIVGFLDADDALHDVSVTALRELSGTRPLAASVISYAEVMTGAELGHHSAERVVGFFDALIRDLLPVDRPVATRAAKIRGERRSLPMPDALILASADLHPDIDTVVCGDGDWSKVPGLACKVELLRPEGD